MADDGNKQLFPQVPFAFPFDVTVGTERLINPGMMLRDYFAAGSFFARLANPNARTDMTDDEMARMAYERADAMLRARVTP